MKPGLQYLALFGLLLSMVGIARASSETMYEVKEQSEYQQTDSSTLIGGYSPLGSAYSQYGALNASVITVDGADLSAAPILGLPSATSTYPSGSVTFPTGPNNSPTRSQGNGYNGYFWYPAFTNSVAGLAAEVGSGTFTFTLGDATLQPTLTLNVASPNFPTTPLLTSASQGTWSGGALQVDPTMNLTLNFNTSSFASYESGLGGIINYQLLNSSGITILPKPVSIYIPDAGYTQSALSSFMINAGTMVAGQSYIVQADYYQVEDVNTTSFTGTGITGDPLGVAADLTSTFITIHVSPEPSTPSLLLVSGVAAWLLMSISKLRRKACR